MEEKKRQRCIYVTARQKKKLIELMNKHPELISCKVTQDFNYGDSHKLWQNIANECNSIPGAKKTWRQWRKTWHDIRSKTKKKQAEINGELPISTVLLASTEQETLDIKNAQFDEEYHRTPEFVPLSDSQRDIFSEEISADFISEPDSPPESKVFNLHEHKTSKLDLTSSRHNKKKAENCYFNCEVLAVQEQRKIQIKEDYLNFKKDYLTQKLKLLKEQTEALKSIAKELSK